MSGQNEGKLADVVVVGAGLIGLSIALEMHARGARVVVVERGLAMRGASVAAAGMLAVGDPHDPLELLPLARMSAGLYTGFLERVEAMSGVAVPFQTQMTLQYDAHGGVTRVAERSIDPRQLASALLAAVRSSSIELVEEAAVAAVEESAGGVRLSTSRGGKIDAAKIVYAAGAWTAEVSGCGVPIAPRKGQMLRVQIPAGIKLDEVHRNEHVYVVPRTAGLQAGTALIGATVEDVGFDKEVHAADVKKLRRMAAEMVPALAMERDAPQVEAWAGLRPATPDLLPVLGACGESALQFVASGHYRNGVLLTPATAVVMADLLQGERPAIGLGAYSAARFWS